MYRKIILGLAFFVGFVCSEAIGQGQIKAPKTVNVYEPIVIEAQEVANVYVWNLSQGAKFVKAENGKLLYVWAPPGKYNVRLMAIAVDFEKKDIKFNEYETDFEVVGQIPTPTPIPQPTPTPTNSFKEAVQLALTKVITTTLPAKTKVAKNYKDIANEAKENNDAWDAATMVNEAKTRNTSELSLNEMKGWKDFFTDLSKAFVALKLQPTDLDGHIKAFEDVAEVLSK